MEKFEIDFKNVRPGQLIVLYVEKRAVPEPGDVIISYNGEINKTNGIWPPDTKRMILRPIDPKKVTVSSSEVKNNKPLKDVIENTVDELIEDLEL